MPCNDNRQQNCSHLSGAPKGVHTYNHNRGDGQFYQVTGTQNIYHFHQSVAPNAGHGGIIGEPTSGEYYDYDEEQTSTDSRELEPYRTIADTLSRIRQQVLSFSERFPSDNTIATICSDAEELVPLVRCVGRTMYQIQQVSPLFFVHPFFSSMESRAFKDDAHLKALGRSLDKFKPCQHPPLGCGPSGDNTCCWPSGSFSSSLRECFRRCSIAMTHFLHVLVSSRFFEKFDIKDVGLEELITKLSPTWDLHCPTVDTIWVREAAGLGWYSIPLRFCETWKEFAMVMNQYCRKGPEVEYIRRGNWAIVDIDDNQTIDQTCFTSILKPDMRFDIGIIVHLLRGHPVHALNVVIKTLEIRQQMDGYIVATSLRNAFNSRSTQPISHSVTSYHTDASTRPSVAKKLWPKLPHTVFRMPKHNSRTPLLPAQKEFEPTKSNSVKQTKKGPYLNTKFHRILANTPHSPVEVRSAETHPVVVSAKEWIMQEQTEEADPVNVPRERKMQEQAEVVALLTKSNQQSFLYFNLFSEKHKRAGWVKIMKGLSPREKAYEEVAHQVVSYLKLLESSLKISSTGLQTTKKAISLLETPTRNPVQLMAGLRSHAEECLSEAQNMEKELRKVRRQIWTISKKVGIDDMTGGKDESHTVDIEKLRGMGDVDLFDVFTKVINQLTNTIARFVAWWNDATMNWKNVKEHMIPFKHGSGTDFLVKEWRDLQLQYQLYREEIMAQQDYYTSKF